MRRRQGRPRLSENHPAAGPNKPHGWPSRLRSYFILNPLIWAYTLTLAALSLASSFFDRNGRIQHDFARLWSCLIMKTILSPVKVTGMNIDIDIDKKKTPHPNPASTPSLMHRRSTFRSSTFICRFNSASSSRVNCWRTHSSAGI